MSLDITYCTPKHCPEDKKKDCKRWTGNLKEVLEVEYISVSDFSQDIKGDPVKECEYYWSLEE